MGKGSCAVSRVSCDSCAMFFSLATNCCTDSQAETSIASPNLLQGLSMVKRSLQVCRNEMSALMWLVNTYHVQASCQAVGTREQQQRSSAIKTTWQELSRDASWACLSSQFLLIQYPVQQRLLPQPFVGTVTNVVKIFANACQNKPTSRLSNACTVCIGNHVQFVPVSGCPSLQISR